MKKPEASCANCRATIRSFADAMRRSRVVLGETGLARGRSEIDKTLPVTGFAMLGEDPEPFMFDFPGLLRNTRCWKRRPPGAACSRSRSNATALSGGCR
jgi:hypothetical protein